MSNIPTPDPQVIMQRLVSKLSDATYQNIQLELIAEALRDERDHAVRERDALSQTIDRMKQTDGPTS